MRNFLSNLEEVKRRKTVQSELLGPPPPGPLLTKRKKKVGGSSRKSKDCPPSSKQSRSASPDSSGAEEQEQLYLSYLSPPASCCRGHCEEYKVDWAKQEEQEPPKPEEQEVVARQQEPYPDPCSQPEFLLNLSLATPPQCQALAARVSARRLCRATILAQLPEVTDKKYRPQTFLQTCLASPPHLRRRAPAPRYILTPEST